MLSVVDRYECFHYLAKERENTKILEMFLIHCYQFTLCIAKGIIYDPNPVAQNSTCISYLCPGRVLVVTFKNGHARK